MADDGEDLGVGELTAGRLTPWRHEPERSGGVGLALAVGVAVAGDAGGVVGLGAEVDEAQLVLDVRERLVDLAVGQRSSAAALARSAVARRAVAVDLGADRHRPLRGVGGRGQRAHVHERPDRHQREGGHRPERDLRPRLGGSNVGRIGLRRRRLGRRRGGLATDRAGGRGGCRSAACGRRRSGRGGLRRTRRLASAVGAASPPPSPNAARRSRERLSRCSGISVTARQTIGGIGRCRGNHRTRCDLGKLGRGR